MVDALSRKSHGLITYLALNPYKNSVAIGDYNLDYHEDRYRASAYDMIAVLSTILQVKQGQWQDEEL